MDTTALDQTLRQRRDTLRREINAAMAQQRENRQAQSLEEVHDAKDDADESMAGRVRDAELERDLHEAQRVDVALKRLADGSYGICVDCGNNIAPERLAAEPASARCLGCESRVEQRQR